jgi:hypothetical protein
MDYLVTEGYKSAAEEFCKEADLAPPVDLQTIGDRMNIREALQRGDVQEAITRVNDLNPEVRFTFTLPSLSQEKIAGLNFSCTTLRHLVNEDTQTPKLQSSI